MGIEIVSVDTSGRILLPKSIRDEYGIDAKFLAIGTEDGVLLRKLDEKVIARRLAEEMKDIDIDAVIKQTREEVRARIKKKYPKVLD